ncbi:predicted protein [Arabidopsis lyrata subsp. lyrata]|uniref:Predicted protein n=1 Tax=Arabidopsis lyrata subsp. lyrata TaxID=81972 RepID=D7MSU1_ARALL|nr:predicted protein [Arabidopsis lyrata subsp. lyrata]
MDCSRDLSRNNDCSCDWRKCVSRLIQEIPEPGHRNHSRTLRFLSIRGLMGETKSEVQFVTCLALTDDAKRLS